ncbi:MAG: hypothetical protein HZB92_01195 [Euryarchaeota archaeon]|nr:hypothetical protein [Euryarchaeota archaeon]
MAVGLLGKYREKIILFDADQETREARNTRHILSRFHSKVFLPESVVGAAPMGLRCEEMEGIPDDNRTILLPGATVDLPPLRYYLSVKGVGTRSPMFGFTDIGGMSPSGTWPGANLADHWRERAYHAPVMTGELWFGNGPWGASGVGGPRDSLEITEMATEAGRPQCINGFWLCPVMAYNRIPDWTVKACKGTYWYRKYRGGWFQEVRIVPSDVRLYFHSDAPLGVKPQTVLKAFGIETPEQHDAFIERFIASGIAALTIGARTARRGPKGFELLDYDDVWLDKDSVVAPNGTIHFADVDDIEWRCYETEEQVRTKLARQFGRNFYEFMFGLDLLMTERARLVSTTQTIAGRRSELAARYEMALMGDPCGRTERSSDGLDLVLKPTEKAVGDVAIRLVDFDGGGPR